MAASQELCSPMLPKGVLFGRAHQFCSKRILNTMYCFRYKIISCLVVSICVLLDQYSNVSSGPKNLKLRKSK